MTTSRDTLVEKISSGLHALASYRMRALCDQPVLREISLPQLHVLVTLQENGPMMVSELAQLFRISPPSASSLVDRMEEHGLVQRLRDVDDRRVVHVEISDYGRGVVEDAIGMKRDHIHRLLAVMSERELRDVHRGIEAVRAALTRVADTADAADREPERTIV